MANKICALCGGAAGVLLLASGALANISDPFIVVTATNASGSGTFSVPLIDTTPGPNGSVSYSLAAPFDIMDGLNVIGTITQLTSSVLPLAGGLPNSINLSFTFLAGTSDTRFVVDTALLCIDPIFDEAARATAGFSITDSNGNGVTSTGNYAGGAHYTARYNGVAPGGTTFANLIAGPVSAGAGDTTTVSDRSPLAGFTPLGADVDDMSAQWDFTLTPGDQIGVTSSYFLVPSPGALSIMGLAGFGFIRRSRR